MDGRAAILDETHKLTKVVQPNRAVIACPSLRCRWAGARGLKGARSPFPLHPSQKLLHYRGILPGELGMKFRYATTITLFDTDASGLLFYGSLFRLTQGCFEAFLREKGFPIERWMTGDLPFLPVRTVEADYRAPLRVGAEIDVVIIDLSIGTSSLIITYSVIDTDRKTECATATVTHVAVGRTDMKAIPFPADIAKIFLRHAS